MPTHNLPVAISAPSKQFTPDTLPVEAPVPMCRRCWKHPAVEDQTKCATCLTEIRIRRALRRTTHGDPQQGGY